MATFIISFWGRLIRRVFFLGLAGSLLSDLSFHRASAKKALQRGLISLTSISGQLLRAEIAVNSEAQERK